MESTIRDGDYVVFRVKPAGTRQRKIVLALGQLTSAPRQHHHPPAARPGWHADAPGGSLRRACAEPAHPRPRLAAARLFLAAPRMPYVPLHDRCPEIARRETRVITILDASAFDLPPADYALVELYCDERGCDCRRVFFYVISSRTRSPEAVVAYGWETDAFYATWAHEDDPEVVRMLKGPVLNLASRQSSHAREILRIIEEIVLRDPTYFARLRAHYDLFRRRLDEGEPRDEDRDEDLAAGAP
jgi:hypothetical protein